MFQRNLRIGISSEELRSLFLEAAKGEPGDADVFFGRFNFVEDLIQGKPAFALNGFLDLLNICRSFDEGAFERIHKGTPYYWLGTSAFLMNDHQSAVFFFDAAVSEDLRAGFDPEVGSTPSYLFILIDGEQPEQAAQDLVKAAQRRVQEIIDYYNERIGRPEGIPNLDIIQIREKFLHLSILPGNERLRSLATTFISFLLEWDYRNRFLDIRSCEGTSEPFFVHLFKGCVLFESLLKATPNDPPPENAYTLGRVLGELHERLGFEHPPDIREDDFEEIQRRVQNPDNSIFEAVEITGKIRNTIGHYIGWEVQLTKNQYHHLFRMVTSSCLHAIACLY